MEMPTICDAEIPTEGRRSRALRESDRDGVAEEIFGDGARPFAMGSCGSANLVVTVSNIVAL